MNSFAHCHFEVNGILGKVQLAGRHSGGVCKNTGICYKPNVIVNINNRVCTSQEQSKPVIKVKSSCQSDT